MVGIKTIDKLCELLDMQPGNIIKYKENEINQKIVYKTIDNKPIAVYNDSCQEEKTTGGKQHGRNGMEV